MVKAFIFFLSLLPKLHLLGLFYNPTNPIFQHFSLTSAADVLPFPSLVVLFLPSLSFCHASVSLSLHHAVVSLSLSLSHFSTLLCHSFYFIIIIIFFLCLLLCLVLGVWVVRKHGTAKGNIYIYSYFGMFSEYIHDFDFFIFIFIGCLVFGC